MKMLQSEPVNKIEPHLAHKNLYQNVTDLPIGMYRNLKNTVLERLALAVSVKPSEEI